MRLVRNSYSRHRQHSSESEEGIERPYDVLRGALKGAPSLAEVEKESLLYYELWLLQSEWITRKIQTLEIIDRDQQAHSQSYDIDFVKVRELRRRHGVDEPRIWLPIATAERRSFFSVDVDGPWKRQCSLATRSENTCILVYVLMGYLKKERAHLDGITQEDVDNFFKFLEYPQGSIDDLLLETPNDDLQRNYYFQLWKCQWHRSNSSATSIPIEEIKATTLADFFRNSEFSELIAYFLFSYFIVVSVPSDLDVSRAILKLRMSVGSSSDFSRSALSYVGGPFVSTWTFPLSSFGDGLGSSLRIISPPGMRIIDAEALVADESGHRVANESVDIALISAEALFHDRHKSGLGLDVPYAADISLNTKRALFTIPALVIASLAFLITFLMLVACSSGDVNQDVVANGLVISIVAAVPVIAAGYLTLEQEHESVSIALGFPRILLISSVLSVLVALLVAFGLENHAFFREVFLESQLAFQGFVCSYFLAAVIVPSLGYRSPLFDRRQKNIIAVFVWVLFLVLSVAITWTLINIADSLESGGAGFVSMLSTVV